MPDEHKHPTDEHGGFAAEQRDPLIRVLHTVIQYAVRALAILMVMVILWGIGDVVWILYQKLTQPPILLLNIGDILQTFGAFLAVLIAIEIFINITVYLREDVIHVKLVIATALMAVARKVIVFDFKEISHEYVWATAAVVMALGLTYWLIARKI
ncbi:MAG: phosphate-starvation-inducible PsiE family protein [Methyloligellaceae bacterium]